jgi:hypothetical protein
MARDSAQGLALVILHLGCRGHGQRGTDIPSLALYGIGVALYLAYHLTGESRWGYGIARNNVN